jgi:hypothetical protein
MPGHPPVEPRAPRAAAELRGEVRREMDASARQRTCDGALASAQATGRLEARARELLGVALRSERTTHAEILTASAPTPGPASRPSADALPSGPHITATGVTETAAGVPTSGSGDRVERVLALVERIERFVRSGRPSLALTLRGGLPGRLELHRVAPGAIAIRLSSSRVPSADELDELRQALEARGLSVRSLEARGLTASAADACSPCP